MLSRRVLVNMACGVSCGFVGMALAGLRGFLVAGIVMVIDAAGFYFAGSPK